MRSTLFYIPAEIAGVPVFGYGLLLVIWAIASIVFLGWLVRRQGFSSDTRGYVPVLLVLGAVIAYLLPAISDENGLPVRGYGVMLLVAVTSGVGLSAYRARRMGVDPEVILSLAFWLFVSGIIGARIFYLIEYWDRLFVDKSWQEAFVTAISIQEGGLVVYGMLLVGGLALIAFIYRHRLPGLALADLIAPGVVLGLGLGRIGCFLNGCCFGGPCDLPWAVTFPADSPPHEQQIRLGQVYGLTVVADAEHRPVIGSLSASQESAALGISAGERIQQINRHNVDTLEEAQKQIAEAFAADKPLELATQRGVRRFSLMAGTHDHSRPVHPTQLYSAIDAFLLCLFLLAYYPFRQHDGEVTAWTLTLHGVTRFLLEIIRTDEGPVFGTGLSISQNISLLVLVIAAGLWIYVLRRPHGSVWPARPAAA
ncbi:MAG TPA: prolipoprotein diacylglyceryl transferase [Pirellulales bacterium]|nr:prolipoprotein diacylglyceryl transferase [Pirellulales bacterium]